MLNTYKEIIKVSFERFIAYKISAICMEDPFFQFPCLHSHHDDSGQ
jgi:hypothetical protein